jgi:hypothetical protein
MVEFWFGDPTSMAVVFLDPGYILSHPEYIGRLRPHEKLFLNLAPSDPLVTAETAIVGYPKVGHELGEVMVNV